MFFEKKCQSLIIQRKIKGIYLKLKMFIEWNFSENKERRLIKASLIRINTSQKHFYQS